MVLEIDRMGIWMLDLNFLLRCFFEWNMKKCCNIGPSKVLIHFLLKMINLDNECAKCPVNRVITIDIQFYYSDMWRTWRTFYWTSNIINILLFCLYLQLNWQLTTNQSIFQFQILPPVMIFLLSLWPSVLPGFNLSILLNAILKFLLQRG